jgi:SNF2 family DNA or RNA helicase
MRHFSYNPNEKYIICSYDENEYFTPKLKGGLWKAKEQRYEFPLNKQNIELMFLHHKSEKDDWKVILQEAMVKYLEQQNKNIVALQFLHKLKNETIKTFPILYEKDKDVPPFSNQHIAQYWGKSLADHAMLWEMGTGKTRSAIEIYEIKKKQRKVNHALVICPLSMVNKWCDQIGQWSSGIAYPIRGTKEEKAEILQDDWEWLVTTYETFARYKDDVLAIVNEKWFVILDETTKIKNPRANRSKAAHELGLKTTHKVILTGTPVTQNAYDVFSQFLFLDCGQTFGINYDAFVDRYFWKSGFKLIAMRGALEQIRDKMFNKSTRFMKKDCIDIPEKVYDNRLLELPPYNKEKYNEMVKYAITMIENSAHITAPIILTQLLRLSQITSGFVKDVDNKETEFEHNPKIDALEEILEDSNGQKVIIWARFQYDVEMIQKLCTKMGIRAVEIYGKTSEQQRYLNVKAFQEQPDVKVIIGTAGTGGHGIDLTAANVVIYYSNSYSLEQRLQSEDRAHRAGQVNQVTYIDLLCKDTIDVAIYKILRSKKSIADVVTKDNLRGLLG